MFPSWRYHAKHGGKKFESQAQLDKAGAGWTESPADHGMEASVPELVPGPMNYKQVVQPIDESVATSDEIEVVAEKRARKKPIELVSVAARRKATKPKK